MASEPRRILFVHAHPDDETLTTGGTIATLVDAGVEVTILTCTRGERGEVIPPELVQLEGDVARLAEHREGELAEAVRILGVTDHRFLGKADARQPGLPPRRYLDSGMVWGDTGPEAVPDPDASSLCSATLGEVAADIAAVIADLRPAAIVSYDERGGYGHPDHIRSHDASRRAAEVMAVPFFEITPAGVEPSAGAVRMDVSSVLPRKVEAMRAHRTQITVDGDQYALSSGPSLPIVTEESYRRIGGSGEEVPDFASQGAGAKSIACGLALVLGAGLGVLGTLNHQATLPIFGVALPLGLVAALLTFTALLIGLRLVFDHRAPQIFAALGCVVVLLVFAQAGPGGSVLIPADGLGYAWTYGSPLIAAIALAWPRLPPRRSG